MSKGATPFRSDRVEVLLLNLAKAIRTQCLDGAQSARFRPNALACGQFYGQKSLGREQCGVHGTAAALMVMHLDNTKDSTDVADKLEAYLAQRSGAADLDSLNVIKQSEILYAIDSTQRHSDVHVQLRAEIISTLLGARYQSKAFPYFTDQSEGNTIPTCYAFRALAIHDKSVSEKTLQFLLEQYDNLDKDRSLPARVKRILIVYSIAYSRYKLDATQTRKLQTMALREYRLSKLDLKTPAEQTIDYYKDSKNLYMRIPWQLYLLASIASLKPGEVEKRSFKHAIAYVYDQLESSGGVRYGSDEPATRTNAVVYELLYKVRDAQLNHPLSPQIDFLDLVSWNIEKPAFRWFIFYVCCILYGMVAYAYHTNKWQMGGLLESITASVVGAFLTKMFQWAKGA